MLLNENLEPSCKDCTPMWFAATAVVSLIIITSLLGNRVFCVVSIRQKAHTVDIGELSAPVHFGWFMCSWLQ